ncbi:helix-turn-helix domain-containing protein, partial [Anaerosalibacter bizertensis]|nr:helix-turn-helix domain-containing protein [Anaerosalibacter bizertensis]
FYKSIIIIPIFSYYEVKNDNISIKTLIKFGRSIKEYVEQEIDYINIVIGIGRYYENILNIDRSYKEAKKALVVEKNMSNGILHFDQMRIYKLLTKVEDKNELRIFYNEILYPIKKYDEKNNTNLLGTLEMYFEYNENMNATSKALYIHVNTLKYRLNRIKEILNIDDLNIENKVELYLSLKVMKLLEKA